MKRVKIGTIILAALTLTVCGCGAMPSARLDNAQHIAAVSNMVEHDIAAAPFLLRTYERVNDPSTDTVRIYIEGDGLAWLSKTQPSLDPTPIHPLALSLAQEDRAANVVYLARPCQYNKFYQGQVCPSQYWKSSRFAPDVITSMNNAVSDIAARYGVHRIELVGYSGGAAVAVLLAAQRSDIVSIRTVAGNLDIETFNTFHHVSAMPASSNPVDVAAKVAAIPQLHFIGGEDKIVPPLIFDSFQRASGYAPCVNGQTVPGATHQDGWLEKWPSLVAAPVACQD